MGARHQRQDLVPPPLARQIPPRVHDGAEHLGPVPLAPVRRLQQNLAPRPAGRGLVLAVGDASLANELAGRGEEGAKVPVVGVVGRLEQLDVACRLL